MCGCSQLPWALLLSSPSPALLAPERGNKFGSALSLPYASHTGTGPKGYDTSRVSMGWTRVGTSSAKCSEMEQLPSPSAALLWPWYMALSWGSLLKGFSDLLPNARFQGIWLECTTGLWKFGRSTCNSSSCSLLLLVPVGAGGSWVQAVLLGNGDGIHSILAGLGGKQIRSEPNKPASTHSYPQPTLRKKTKRGELVWEERYGFIFSNTDSLIASTSSVFASGEF